MYVCLNAGCRNGFTAGRTGMVIGEDVICPWCGGHWGTDYDEPDLSHWLVEETIGSREEAIVGDKVEEPGG